MAKKVFNMQGGLHSAAAYAALWNRSYGSCVGNAASFVVTPGTGMNLSISTGDGLISVDAFLGRLIQTTAAENALVSAANASFNRIDTVVAYIDNTVTPTTSVLDNVNDILKFKVVPGTAASTPVAPTGAAIQSSIGAGNPYMALYDALIPQNATNVAGVTLTDRRNVLTKLIANAVYTASIADSAVTTPKIADGAITSLKLIEGFLRARRKNNVTDVNETGLRVQYGWGFCTAVGGTTFSNTKTVTFPVAFSGPPLVMGTGAGYIDGADPVNSTDLSNWEKSSAAVGNVTTTNFIARCYAGGDSIAATRRMGFTWIAIGPA